MGRTLDQVIASLPAERQDRIEARFNDLKDEVEGLRALRIAAGKAQADVATALKIKQPSVSKIEKQADMYLSTLRSYVEAIGGTLDLVVTLPSRAPMRLHHICDVGAGHADPTTVVHGRTRHPSAHATGKPRRAAAKAARQTVSAHD
jgi:DNA-binding XRE family transcriptional regulator